MAGLHVLSVIWRLHERSTCFRAVRSLEIWQVRVIELSLRPYHGKLFLTTSKAEYSRAHEELFSTPDILTCAEAGRFCGGEGKNGYWTYLIYANRPHYLAHELTHVLLHVWERCGMNPSDSGGEAFCYMLSQLMLDATTKNRGSHEPIPP